MEETNQNLPVESDLSSQLITEIRYEQATRWQRFFNFLIDYLLMNFALSKLTAMAVGAFLGMVTPEYILRLTEGGADQVDIFLLSYFVWIVNVIIYYTICEKGFKGYTLGKVITGTRAIRDDGGELTVKDALLRSLCRLVPFELFSGFGYPWHDTWTKTAVIKSR